MFNILILIICFALLVSGCGRKRAVVTEEAPPKKVATAAVAPEAAETLAPGGDMKTVQELAGRNSVNPDEAARVSNRLLQPETAPLLDEQTLNNLEKILLAALPNSSPTNQPVIQRNLGIVNYYNKKYNKARQALQSANESNPRDARTHYYLACLFNHQAKVYTAKGDPVKAQRFQKRAQIEIETAQKIEPTNPLYRKGLAGLGE